MAFSEKFANYLIDIKNLDNEDEKDILKYGSEVFFTTICGTTITLLIGWLVGVIYPLWAILLVSIIVRKLAGGAHSEYPISCFFITAFFYTLIAFLAIKTQFFFEQYKNTVIFLASMIALIVISKKAPVESLAKPLGFYQKKQLKLFSFIAIILLIVIQISFLYLQLYPLINYAISLVLIWHALMLLPLGQYLVSYIDKFYLMLKEVNLNEKN